MPNLKVLNLMCGFMQIIGLILIMTSMFLPTYFLAIIAVTGFAGFVRMFLPVEGNQDFIAVAGSLCAIGITIFSILRLAIVT